MATMESPQVLLGKTSDSEEVSQFLDSINADPPRLKKGDVNAYSEAPSQGMSCVFTDEGFHADDENLALGEGSLILTNITLFTSGEEGYETFSGELPFGLNFEMDRGSVRNKLGQPEWSSDRMCKDRWRIESCWLFVTYKKDFQDILKCSIQVPD